MVCRVCPTNPREEAPGLDPGAVHDLLEASTANELVVVVSARRGRLGWHPELRTLPNRVATETSGNFAIVYPKVERSGDERRFLEL